MLYKYKFKNLLLKKYKNKTIKKIKNTVLDGKKHLFHFNNEKGTPIKRPPD